MNLERAAMKGKLAEAQQTRNRLRMRIEGVAKALCQGLNTVLTPPDELPVLQLDEQWDVLKEAWGELGVANETIARLEKELR